MDRKDPWWVTAPLNWPWTWLLARIGLTSAYIVGGVDKLANFDAAIAEQAHFGLRPAWLWATLAIAVELIGPVLIISGRFVWLGAGAIGVLTAIATFVANDFWNLTGAARSAAFNEFFEHVGLIAGFVLVALVAEHKRRIEAPHANVT
jgi:uncharacterized membrane protein YphA (DoxX/SURF4 family)